MPIHHPDHRDPDSRIPGMDNHEMKAALAYFSAMEERIQRALTAHLDPDRGTLEAAVHYALEVKGKRLRPMIMLTLVEALGGDPQQFMGLATAMEYIHTYSLIHDDHPSMDNDDYRRGQPTVHRRFNDAVALLAGDTLLTMAFEKIASESGFSAEARIHFIQLITECIGMQGMAGGQALDLEFSGDPAAIREIHRLKTGELIRGIMVGTGRLMGLDAERIQALDRAGKEIGTAFQLADDLLDVLGDEELVGKKLHKDSANRSPNAALFFGIDSVQQEIDRLFRVTMDELKKVGITFSPFLVLMHMMVYREH
ncbi:MAG: polyprenyl synthetase family protein [Acidobacteriota bacterium]|jgi:geranylgeranyl diphosphate synthase type II|nr:polyprenyl synthetase family protein [Acidobacteriota bacterium]